MEKRSTRTEGGLTAELNDLLRLDHDAIEAYTIAIRNLKSEPLRRAILEFRADHERHVEHVTRLVRRHGGTPLDPERVSPGTYGSAVQRVEATDSDRGIMLAYKANERLIRDRYRVAAGTAGRPADVAEVLRRNAGDEERHYSWAVGALISLGAEHDASVGGADVAFERMSEPAADAVEKGAAADAVDAVTEAGTVEDTPPDDTRREASAVAGTDQLEALVHGLADSLEHAASYLRSRDLSALRDDFESRVRMHPLRAALIAVAAGFVLGRTLR